MKSAERIKYFYETIISENQIERMAEFISPECCVKMGEKLIPVGIDGMKEHIKATKQTYPDYRMKIIKQFCDGDYVISEFIMEGTHKGEWIGIKPTGKHHHNRVSYQRRGCSCHEKSGNNLRTDYFGRHERNT